MKKKKRLLSLCLGLVLVLGVSACEDLGDILGDQGSDESDITTELEEGDGDNNKGNDDTSESNISYTYSVLITNEDELTPLVVEGDTVTAKVELVTTTHNRVTGDEESNSVDATADDVVLQSSTAGVLEIEGLTINPIGAGTTTLTAYWSEHDATSSGVEITVSEPDSYTYKLTINNKDSYTDLTTESTLDDVSITLTTYKNGVVEGTPETGSGETVSLVSTNTSVITVESGSLSLTIVGAGDTIITAYWIGHEEEESAIDTIAITISEPSSGGGEGTGEGGEEPGGSGENPGGGEEPGGDEGGDTGGGTGDTGGDEGGGSGEGGGTGEGGDDDEPGGDEPETVYIETLTFNESTYELDLEENTTASFSVTALGPDGATPSDPDAYSVEIVDTNVAAIEEGVIVAKEVGATTIKATSTDNPSDPKYGEASITVTLGYEPVTSFSVSPETIELNVGSSVTLGYGENDDYKVSVTPETATKTSFTLTGTTDEYLTISEKGTDNTYTITAPDDVSGAGAAVRTYALTIASDDPNSTASKNITVVVSEIPEVAHPVTSITLTGDLTTGDTYTKTIGHTGSFTIGPTGSSADVIASVNEDAYDTSIKAYSESTYISITGPALDTGIYTVTVVETEDAEHEATITIESAVNSSVSATLNLTISQAESRISSISVSPTSIDMLTDDSLTLGTTDNELTVTISDQYGQEVSGAEWVAAISTSSEEGVISSIDTSVANQITITTGNTVGTGYIDFSIKDNSDIEPATLQVNVTQHYYDIDTITYEDSEITLTYDLANTTPGSTTEIDSNKVTYSSEYGPVITEDADFALYSADTTHIEINEKSITAVAPTDEAVTVYIYLVGSSDVYTTISVTVSDVTDYTPVSVEISGTTTDLTINEGGSTTISELGLGVSISPSYASQDYSVKVLTGGDYLTASEVNGVWTLTASEVDTDTICTVRIYANNYEESVYQDITITIKAVMPTVITGYSVTFTFTSSLPSDAKLLMSATGDGVSVSDVTLGSGSGTSFIYTFTEGLAIGTEITYSLTIAYIDEGAPEDSEVSIGDFSAVVHYSNDGTSKSDYSNINDTIDTNVSLDSYLVDSTAEFKYNITINFYFVGEDGEGNYKIPDYADGFLGGYLYTHPWESADDGSIYTDATEATKLTENAIDDTTYYSITLDQLYNGDVRFDIYFEHTSKESGGDSELVEWIHCETSYTVDKYLEDGSTISVDVYADPSTYISDDTSSGGGEEPGGGTGGSSSSEFYFVVFDNKGGDYWGTTIELSNITELTSGTSCFNGKTTASVSTGTTQADQSYIYTTDPGTSGFGENAWFTFTHNGEYDYQIALGTITIPTESDIEEGKVAIYVACFNNGDMSHSGSAWSGYWTCEYSSVSACVSAIGTSWLS